MKLIDLLVQELPKRGGWPEGVVKIHQDYDGETWGWLVHDSAELLFTLDQVATNARKYGKKEKCENMVTREQYESALAASQKTAWNGEGLPPVGCECEVSADGGRSWCTYRAINEKNGVRLIEIGNLTEEFENDNWIFRPLHTEAERKRDEAVEAIDFYMTEFIPDTPNEFYHAKKIYDTIAAGKIPGVKLDD